MLDEPWNQLNWNEMGESISKQEFHMVRSCAWQPMEWLCFWTWPSHQFQTAAMELQSNRTINWEGKMWLYRCVSRSWLTSREHHSHHTNHFACPAPIYPWNLEKNHHERQTTLFPKGCCYALLKSGAVEYPWGLGQRSTWWHITVWALANP